MTNAFVFETCNLVIPAPGVIVVVVAVARSGCFAGVIVLINEFIGAALFADLAATNFVLVEGKGGGKESA